MRLVAVAVKIRTAVFCIATPCSLVVVIEVSEEPNEVMAVLTGLPYPHRKPFTRDALQQPCCSCCVLSRYAVRPVPAALSSSRHAVLLSLSSCYTQKHNKYNFILGNWPQPCNNRQKFCVYLTLST
jgi:hypothetical protein